MEQTPQFSNPIKIPQLSDTKDDSTLIGVIDSSGSMISYWKHVSHFWNTYTKQCKSKILITFSSRCKVFSGDDAQQMTDKIYDYGGYRTNITQAFEIVNEKIKLDCYSKNITILFISDGMDNELNTLEQRLQDIFINLKNNKKINFLSVGVGKEFPTFLSMRLRNMYHSGEHNIPPVFLIDSPYEQECWVENAQNIEPVLYHQPKIELNEQVKNFPWGTDDNIAYENQWILSTSPKVTVKKTGATLQTLSSLNFQDLTSISKQWIGQLSLTSLKQQVQEQAKQCLELINYWITQIPQVKESGKKTFHEKMLLKTKGSSEQDFQIILKELKAFAQENILEKLTELEAAKRLAIGTKLGKYHGNALKIRGITVEEYEVARNQFVNLLNNKPLSAESNQDPSVITLQNQKDVFLETNFKEGLQLCPSQYDLVELLPLVGHGISLKRTHGSMIEPYKIEVVGIAKHHNILDTVSLQSGIDNQLQLKTGNDETETINAVLPLFGEKDTDLKPFITSKLFSVLMTFNVMQNADTCYEYAYIALMANTLSYLLVQEASEWRDNLLEKLYQTLKITYASGKGFQTFSQKLLNEPRMATVTDHPDSTTKCEDLSKTLLALFYQLKEGKITEREQMLKILFAIFADVVARHYPNETPLTHFFQLKDENALKKVDFSAYSQILINQFTAIQKYYSHVDIRKELARKVTQLDIQVDLDTTMTLKKQNLKFLKENGKFSLNNLVKIFTFFMGDEEENIINDQNIIVWLNHASKYRNSYERNQVQMDTDPAHILENVKSEKQAEILKNNTIFEDTAAILEEKFTEYMVKIHLYVKPMNKHTLKQNLSNKQRLNEGQYKFNSTSSLLKNACMAPDCPFFLEINSSLSLHMEALQCCPAFHKCIYNMRNCNNNEEILEAILKAEYFDMVDNPHIAKSRVIPLRFQKLCEQNKQVMLNNIERIKFDYRKM